MLDLNGAGEQRADGLIPDGTYCMVKMQIKPGGFSLGETDPIDEGLFTLSKTSDVVMMVCEFTVLSGPHRARKFWQNFTVDGGKIDDNGVSRGWKISKQTLLAIANSAFEVDPKDNSDRAKGMRNLNGFRDLDGVEFPVKVGVEAGGDYPDKNRISYVVVPGEPEYDAIRGGEDVPPNPTSRPRGPSEAGGASAAQQRTFGWSAASKTDAARPEAQNRWARPQSTQQTPTATTVSGPNWLKGE